MSLISRLLGTPETSAIPYPQDSAEGLAARWVQWGASIHVDCNPIADDTGKHAHTEQPEDVWFLAGCFGGTVKRKCKIPANRKIFFPVFNIWIWDGETPPDLSKSYGQITIDGQEVEPDSIYTKIPFPVKGVWGNPVTGSIFSKSMLVGGLWKLIDPPAPGDHEINFCGGDGGGFALDVTYYITIKSK